MVRPEPHQPLGKADFGIERGIKCSPLTSFEKKFCCSGRGSVSERGASAAAPCALRRRSWSAMASVPPRCAPDDCLRACARAAPRRRRGSRPARWSGGPDRAMRAGARTFQLGEQGRRADRTRWPRSSPAARPRPNRCNASAASRSCLAEPWCSTAADRGPRIDVIHETALQARASHGGGGRGATASSVGQAAARRWPGYPAAGSVPPWSPGCQRGDRAEGAECGLRMQRSCSSKPKCYNLKHTDDPGSSSKPGRERFCRSAVADSAILHSAEPLAKCAV